jgi:hypothetical protein
MRNARGTRKKLQASELFCTHAIQGVKCYILKQKTPREPFHGGYFVFLREIPSLLLRSQSDFRLIPSCFARAVSLILT